MICFILLLLTALRALVKSPFCPQRLTSVQRAETGPDPLAIFCHMSGTRHRGKIKVPQQQPKDIIKVPDLNRTFRFERNVPKT